jgi:hypothetical protein
MTNLDPAFKYFAVVDCTMGFHQVDLAEESKPFTAFTICSPATVAGTYFLNRLPMGLKGTTDAHDHRITGTITGTISNVTDCLLNEDGLVGSPTLDGLERKLLAIAHRCNEHDISLSPAKFQIGSRVTFCGYDLSQGEYLRDPAMVPALTSKAELKSFLGLASQLLSHTK